MEERMRPDELVRAPGCCGAGNLLLMLIAGATQADAQQKDKKNKNTSPTPTATTNGPTIPLSDEQQIDYLISTNLGAWQVGDIDKLHGTYGDDVTIVQGPSLPPVVGWNNYLPLYQQQHARMQQVRMDRSNTVIKVNGNCAWATFQWDFSAADRWAAVGIARAYDAGDGQAEREMGDYVESHFGGGAGRRSSNSARRDRRSLIDHDGYG